MNEKVGVSRVASGVAIVVYIWLIILVNYQSYINNNCQTPDATWVGANTQTCKFFPVA